MPDAKVTVRIPEDQKKRVDQSVERIRKQGGSRVRYSFNDWLLDAAQEKLNRKEKPE